MEIYIADTSEFVFPDVMNFLASLKNNGHTAYILSFGDEQYQMAKIVGSGISVCVEKIIVAGKDKAEAMQHEVNFDDEIWFLDDRTYFLRDVKQVFPDIRTVLVQRPEGRYHDEPTAFCDFTVKDLASAEEIMI